MQRAGSGLAIGFLIGLALLARRDLRAASARAAARGAPPPAPGVAATPQQDADPDDDVLLARVLAAVKLPGDVEVAVMDGAVVLFGRVPRYLVPGLLARVVAVDGVDVVEDRLTPVDLVAPERPPGPPHRA